MRVLELLKSRGLLGYEAELDSFADQEPLLASISGASITSTIATGQRAGKRVLRLGGGPRNELWATRKRTFGAHIDGFDLHASTALAAGDREALEALLRYQLRPPLSKSRLTRLDDGRVQLKLRSPWSDGTSHLILEPHELIEKLVPLIPRPGTNLIVYHGCLAPRAKDRESIVAYGRANQSLELDPSCCQQELFDDEEAGEEPRTSRYYSWSELMARVHGVDVLECPRCPSRLKFIDLVTDPLVITALLISIGLLAASSSFRAPPRPNRCSIGQLPLFSKSDLRFQAHTTAHSLTTQLDLDTSSGCRSPPGEAETSRVFH